MGDLLDKQNFFIILNEISMCGLTLEVYVAMLIYFFKQH